MNQKKIQTETERAQQIVEGIWKASEEYHAGAIDHAEYGRRTMNLHCAAEREQLGEMVRATLRKA